MTAGEPDHSGRSIPTGDAWAKPERNWPGTSKSALVALVLSVGSLGAYVTAFAVIYSWVDGGPRGGADTGQVLLGILAVPIPFVAWTAISAGRKCAGAGVRRGVIAAAAVTALAASIVAVLASWGVL